jgi:GNAT superfamily N-acetyltransferase
MPDDVVIRAATSADLPVLGRLGALLMHAHYEFDPKRFLAPGNDAEEGYAWFLGTQLRNKDAAVFVADRDGEVLGYVYAAVEPLSWKELRDECGFIHDIVVEERGRRSGLATALIERAIEWLRERGMPRVVLGTADRNHAAQCLFTALGFRRTMIEMTREL